MTTFTPEQRSRWGRRGGRARAQMPDFLEHQRRAGRRSAQVNDMAALGRKGFEAAAAKYGWDFAFQRARCWRLDHPSRPEQQVIAILNQIQVFYQREAQVLGEDVPLAVDFLIDGTTKIIEVNGKVHTDPFFSDGGDRWKREALRLERIRHAGFQVLVVDHHDLLNLDHVRHQIAKFLEEPA